MIDMNINISCIHTLFEFWIFIYDVLNINNILGEGSLSKIIETTCKKKYGLTYSLEINFVKKVHVILSESNVSNAV